MSLQNWLNNAWLRPHKTSREEIRNLWLLADRDIRDAAAGVISEDERLVWREADTARRDAIQVDAFPLEEFAELAI